MAVSEIQQNAASTKHRSYTASQRRGPITKGLMEWRPNGVGPFAFCGTSGPDAASGLLLKAHAMTLCLANAFATADETQECDFANLVDGYKGLALEGIGDLILLAKVLVDEA